MVIVVSQVQVRLAVSLVFICRTPDSSWGSRHSNSGYRELDTDHLANVGFCLSQPGTGPYDGLVQMARGVGKSAL